VKVGNATLSVKESPRGVDLAELVAVSIASEQLISPDSRGPGGHASITSTLTAPDSADALRHRLMSRQHCGLVSTMRREDLHTVSTPSALFLQLRELQCSVIHERGLGAHWGGGGTAIAR